MPPSALRVVLRDGDRERLSGLLRASSAPAGLVQRARIVLLAADGVTNTDIAARVGASRQTVVSWRRRSVEGGLAALDDADRPGRPRVHDEVTVVVATLEPPPEHLGVTHWSTRLLADHLEMSFATVARIWRKWRLQPWRIETFKFSTEPEGSLPHCRGHRRGGFRHRAWVSLNSSPCWRLRSANAVARASAAVPMYRRDLGWRGGQPW